MNWKERVIGLPLALLGAVLLLATLAGMLLTRTDWGREKVRVYAVEKLNAAIRGSVQIDEVLSGDLLRMVTMAGVRLYEEDGREFASIDTLMVQYRWSDFLFGDLTFARATIINPVVTLRTESETGWNFEEAFRGPRSKQPTAREGDDDGLRIELDDVAIRSGEVRMLIPWDPAEGTGPDSVRWHLVEAYGEWWRELRFERLNSLLSKAQLVVPREESRQFQIVQFTSRVTILDDPFEVQQLRGYIEVVGNRLAFDVSEGILPGSNLFGEGWVTLESNPRYDFRMHASPMSTADIQWLLPWMPSGTARLDYHMRTLPDGIALEAQDARWESADAIATGRFALSMRDRPDGLAFDALDVSVERVNTTLIEYLTGWESPVNAELSGEVALDGPLSQLAVEADVSIRPAGEDRPTRIAALGTVHAWHLWRGELGAQNLQLDFDTVRLGLVRAFAPEMALQGDVTGSAYLDGRLADGISVDFSLEQRDGDLTPTTVDGRGTVSADTSGMLLDVDMHSDSFSFTTLSRYYPWILFRGDFAGDFSARGRPTALAVDASFTGAGESIRFDGELRLTETEVGYEGEMEGRRIRVVPFRAGLPESDVDFRAELVGTGTEPANLEARGHLEVFSSFVGGVRLDTAYSDLRLTDGRLVVDSGAAIAEFGEISLRGALGLIPDSTGRLAFDIAADSLGGLTPWVFPGYGRIGGPGLTPGSSGEADGVGATRVDGSARIRGELEGVLGDVAVRAELAGGGLRYGIWAADSLVIKGLEASGSADSLDLVGAALVVGGSAGDVRLASLDVQGDIAGDQLSVDFNLAVDSTAGAVGEMKIEFGTESSTLAFERLEMRLDGTRWTMSQPTEVSLASSGGIVAGDLRITSDSGHLRADGAIRETGPATFIADVDGVDLAAIARLFPDSFDVGGRLTAGVGFSGTTESPTVQGSFEVRDGRLVGVPFTSLRGELELVDDDASLDISMWDGDSRLLRVHGTYPVDLTLPGFTLDIPEREIRLTVEGDSIPLELASLLFGNQIAEPYGHAYGTVSIGGTPDSLSLEGPVAFVDGGFRVIYSGITYRSFTGDAFFQGQDLHLLNVSFEGVPLREDDSGGRGVLGGRLNLSDLRDPGFDLTIVGDGLPIYDQLDARFIVSGSVWLRGRYRGPIVGGDLSVVSGVLFMDEIGRQAQIADPYIEEGSFLLLDSPALRTVLRPSNPFLDNLTLDLDVDVAQDTWLRSADANISISGDLLISRRPGQDAWRIDGTLLAERGDYRLFNRRFEVSEGTIEFVGTQEMNPNLRIVALYNLRTQKRPIEIRLIIGGTLEDMTLSLESDAQPPIPESDLLSYLILGRPSYEITRPSEERSLLSDVAADVPGTFLGYALGSLLVGETGVAYIDVSRVNYWGGAEGGEFQEGVGPSFSATQVEVGWYLAPTVFVSVAQHLAGAVRPTVRLEWKLDENLTLRGITQPRWGQANPLVLEVPGANLDQSIGLFLFYGWNY